MYPASINRFEQRREINGGAWIEFDAIVAAGYGNFRMAECWKVAARHSLADEFIPPVSRRTLDLPHEIRQVRYCAKVPGAVESHLARREEIRYRSRMKAGEISGDHV